MLNCKATNTSQPSNSSLNQHFSIAIVIEFGFGLQCLVYLRLLHQAPISKPLRTARPRNRLGLDIGMGMHFLLSIIHSLLLPHLFVVHLYASATNFEPQTCLHHQELVWSGFSSTSGEEIVGIEGGNYILS